jgi:hypothetical protein
MLKLIISIFLTAVISVIVNFFPIEKIDPQLKPYYDQFNEIALQTCPIIKLNHPKHRIIKMDNLDLGVMGLCQIYSSGYILSIDKGYWKRDGEDVRFSTFMHEILHCALFIEHSRDPKNLMYPTENYITKEETIRQVIKIIKNKCPN